MSWIARSSAGIGFSVFNVGAWNPWVRSRPIPDRSRARCTSTDAQLRQLPFDSFILLLLPSGGAGCRGRLAGRVGERVAPEPLRRERLHEPVDRLLGRHPAPPQPESFQANP